MKNSHFCTSKTRHLTTKSLTESLAHKTNKKRFYFLKYNLKKIALLDELISALNSQEYQPIQISQINRDVRNLQTY